MKCSVKQLRDDYMIPVGRNEILSKWKNDAGIPAVLQIHHKLFFPITCKSFYSGHVGSLFRTAVIPKLFHAIASFRLSWMKKLINTSV